MGIITVDTRDRKPIWEQLTDNIKLLILRGIFKPDEQLPGVRTLAGELAINPNTIAKAYAELERQGIIYSIVGRGSFVSDTVEHLRTAQRTEAVQALRQSLKNAFEAGASMEDIIKMAKEIGEEQK